MKEAAFSRVILLRFPTLNLWRQRNYPKLRFCFFPLFPVHPLAVFYLIEKWREKIDDYKIYCCTVAADYVCSCLRKRKTTVCGHCSRKNSENLKSFCFKIKTTRCLYILFFWSFNWFSKSKKRCTNQKGYFGKPYQWRNQITTDDFCTVAHQHCFAVPFSIFSSFGELKLSTTSITTEEMVELAVLVCFLSLSLSHLLWLTLVHTLWCSRKCQWEWEGGEETVVKKGRENIEVVMLVDTTTTTDCFHSEKSERKQNTVPFLFSFALSSSSSSAASRRW